MVGSSQIACSLGRTAGRRRTQTLRTQTDAVGSVCHPELLSQEPFEKGAPSVAQSRPRQFPFSIALGEERPERLFSVAVCVRSVCVCLWPAVVRRRMPYSVRAEKSTRRISSIPRQFGANRAPPLAPAAHPEGGTMPEKQTIERARRDKREGKSPSTQAGEFVREEVHHVREGKHGARSAKQAIAIGLSKARRAGVNLPPPRKRAGGTASARGTKRASARKRPQSRPSPRRAKAVKRALRREPRSSASPRALARHARQAARQRPARERSLAAKKAARTKGPVVRKAAARKAARTRAHRRA